MTGQKVSRCTANNPSTCVWIPVSVPAQLDGSGLEGGEPMMMMLRCSVLVVILAMDVLVDMYRREARTITAIQRTDRMLFS